MIAKNFRVVKPFKCEFGPLNVDTEIMVIRDTIYVRGMQIMPQFYAFFHSLIDDEMKNPYYLMEIPLPNSLSERVI